VEVTSHRLVITLGGKEESRLNKKEIAQNDMKLDIYSTAVVYFTSSHQH
jgi:hypothetical protein